MATRHRAFNAVFYPESAPEGFRELIASWHVPALLVLHDRDEGKKPHYHLLLMFAGMKSLRQVHDSTDGLGSKELQPSYDLRGSARYLGHLDQPEKFQYGVGVIESFSGASVPDLTASMVDPTPEILTWVRAEGFADYSALVDYCQDHRPEWLKQVTGHTMFWTGYFASVRFRRAPR